MAQPKKISPEFLTRVKAAVNLVDIVGEHVVLRKSGSNLSGLCPFHSERTPSFSVSPQKQVYHCYGCKKGGDVVSFMIDMHGLSFIEAVEELAERSKIALPSEWKHHSNENLSEEERKKLEAARERASVGFRLNRFAAQAFHTRLSKDPQAQSYLRKRGVTEELIRSFYVGVTPNEWESLSLHLQKAKAPLNLAADLGLISPSQKGALSQTGYFDLFRGRIVFPILDLRGRISGFGGRQIEDDPEKKNPKYLNSRESAWFHKSKVLFGLFQAQKHIREQDAAILVEGYFDVVALHRAGFQNAVATCGTAMTADHLKILNRFASRIIVLFDRDRAGIEATEKAMLLGLEHGVLLHSAKLPSEKDPDEYLLDSASGNLLQDRIETLRAALQNSKPILDSEADQLVEDAKQGPEQKTRVIKQLSAWLSALKDPIAKTVRAQHFSQALSIDMKLLVGETVSGIRPSSAPSFGQSSPGRPYPNASVKMPQNRSSARAPMRGKPNTASNAEKIFIFGLSRPDEMAPVIEEIRCQLPPESRLDQLFTHPSAQEYVQRFLEEGPSVFQSPSEVSLKDPELLSWLTAIWTGHSSEPSRLEVRSAGASLLKSFWARFSQQVKSEMREAEAQKNTGLHEKLMQDYLDLQRKIKELSSLYDQG